MMYKFFDFILVLFTGICINSEFQNERSPGRRPRLGFSINSVL